MTYPWSSGDVLTASDLNAYAGLVPVKSQTIGTAVSSVTVTSAFSSTFDNYRIIIANGTGTVSGGGIYLSLGAGNTWYAHGTYELYSGTGYTVPQNATSTCFIGTMDTVNSGIGISLDIMAPGLATGSKVVGLFHGGGYGGRFWGINTNLSANTAFTIAPTSGTLTGGTIKVYGYNNG